MTLRGFVEHGIVGTRDQREQFETELLEVWAAAARYHGITHASVFDLTMPLPLWIDTFLFWATPHGWTEPR